MYSSDFEKQANQLAQLDCFAHLTNKNVKELSFYIKRKKYGKGDYVFEEG